MILETYPTVYQPREDSQLLAREVGKVAKGKKLLDVGCGSGIIAITAALAGAKQVWACDLNPAAVRNTEDNSMANKVIIRTFISDLMEVVSPEDRFDLIVFNAPYLPPQQPIDIQWSGGAPLLHKFFKQARQHLEKDGKIMVVFSSLTKLQGDYKVIAEETMPDGEKLIVGLLS